MEKKSFGQRLVKLLPWAGAGIALWALDPTGITAAVTAVKAMGTGAAAGAAATTAAAPVITLEGVAKSAAVMAAGYIVTKVAIDPRADRIAAAADNYVSRSEAALQKLEERLGSNVSAVAATVETV